MCPIIAFLKFDLLPEIALFVSVKADESCPARPGDPKAEVWVVLRLVMFDGLYHKDTKPRMVCVPFWPLCS